MSLYLHGRPVCLRSEVASLLTLWLSLFNYHRRAFFWLAGQVAALHALGPNYQSIFAPTESNPLLEQAPAAATLLIHSKEALGSRLVLSYNAQAAAGRMLYNTTDMDGAADVEHQTAAVQEGSQLCCTCHLRDLLHCLGGVSILLPLVSVHQTVALEQGDERSTCVASAGLTHHLPSSGFAADDNNADLFPIKVSPVHECNMC